MKWAMDWRKDLLEWESQISSLNKRSVLNSITRSHYNDNIISFVNLLLRWWDQLFKVQTLARQKYRSVCAKIPPCTCFSNKYWVRDSGKIQMSYKKSLACKDISTKKLLSLDSFCNHLVTEFTFGKKLVKAVFQQEKTIWDKTKLDLDIVN